MCSTVKRQERVGKDTTDVEECPTERREDCSDPEEGRFVDDKERTGVYAAQDGEGDQERLPICY